MVNVGVKAAIAKAQAKVAAKVEVKAEEVLAELKRIALADIGQAFDSLGRLKPIHEIPEEVRRAISGIENEELFGVVVTPNGLTREHQGNVRKVKFWNKNEALRDLAKHLGLLKDVVKHEGLTLEALVAASMGADQ